MSDAPEFRVLEDAGLLQIIFSRPEKLNALTDGMLVGLEDAVRLFEARADLRVLLITAEGRYFSAGRDISGGLTPDFGESALEARRWYRTSMQRIADMIERVEKPSVVAHQGPCMGGALELSLSCDFRLAARSAAYGLPEIKLGVLPGSGGISRLARLVGPHWTRYLALAGRKIDAETARQIGLVHEIHDDEAFGGAIQQFCRELIALPPEAVAAAKVVIDLTLGSGREEGRQLDRLANGFLMLGEEYHREVAKAVNRLKDKSR